ncbi:MAG: hypothetical protein QXD55_00485 [Candidatus Aenigmatarchaeota archaeon]
MPFYGERSCSIKCNSECCYFPRPGEPFSKIEEKQINKVINAVKNNLEAFLPEYREIVKKIVKEGFIVEKFDTKYLKCDTTKTGFDSCMVPYYPCVFLANSENFFNENKACMIYPYRFSFCKNTTPENYGCKR